MRAVVILVATIWSLSACSQTETECLDECCMEIQNDEAECENRHRNDSPVPECKNRCVDLG